MTLNTLLAYGLLGLLALATAAFVYIHWRHHIHATPLDSPASLERRLNRGKPVLVQFHAPL